MFTTRPVLSGTYGMVATTHWLATAAGMAVLEAGGTAADAAAAAGFALHVVEPHLNGPGGDMPLIVGTAGDPDPRCSAGRARSGRARPWPGSATSWGSTLVPGTGPLAATVPGAFGAWIELCAPRPAAAARRAVVRDRLRAGRATRCTRGWPGHDRDVRAAVP